MKPNYLLSLATFFCFGILFSQTCGFDEYRAAQIEKNPELVQILQQEEERLQQNIANSHLKRNSDVIYTIPVVVHVMHLGEAVGTGSNISDAQIQSSIDHLTNFYRGQTTSSPTDFGIEFILAKRGPDCNVTTGINRVNASGISNYATNGIKFGSTGTGADEETLKDLSRWSETEYFNIWIVTEINGNNGGYGTQGYAHFYAGHDYEGAVMMSNVFGYDPGNTNGWGLSSNGNNTTVLHEVGHYLHLLHTFEGDDTDNDGYSDTCPADVTVGADSDGCADTEPHKRETSSCPSINNCTGNAWLNNNTVNNIMSYYHCIDRLTNDQRTRARAAIEGTEIINSKASLPLDPNFVQPTTACTVAPATLPLPYSASGILSVALNNSTYVSGSTNRDAYFLGNGGILDFTDNCLKFFQINGSNTYSLEVGLYENNLQQLGVWIDWNDDGDFDDEAEQQYLDDDLPGGSTVSISLTYPTNIPYNDYVRLRLITEKSSSLDGRIDSPCYSSLEWGQSEDYSIYIENETLTVEENSLNNLKIVSDNANNQLIINGNFNNQTTFSLFDLQGRVVLNTIFAPNQKNTHHIDVSTLNTGIYIAKLIDNKYSKTKKILVE